MPGYTYLGILLLIALLGLSATAAALTWRVVDQRDKELQLLYAGRAYAQALQEWHVAHAGQTPSWPTRLDQLLEDRIGLRLHRYLRQAYLDPMTGRGDWVLLRDAAGGIVGLHSASAREPVRRRAPPGTPDGLAWSRARTYQDWVFGGGGVQAAAGGGRGVLLIPGLPTGNGPPATGTGPVGDSADEGTGAPRWSTPDGGPPSAADTGGS